jgi:hypothetical protein
MVPGCLTGESEERETWTAESLRAASSLGRVRPDETSAVHVSGQHPVTQVTGVDLVNVAARERRHARNVVISRFKFSPT